MGRMTGPWLDVLRTRHADARGVPQAFVETGTFRGHTTMLAASRFPRCWTIELSPVLHAEAQANYGTLAPHIQFLLGDSREVIPRLAAEIDEPALWYLDAHWFDRPGVAGRAEGLPLWAELAAIAARPYRGEIIVVDDVNDFGTANPTPEWLDISLARISDHFPGFREAVVLHDQAVIYR